MTRLLPEVPRTPIAGSTRKGTATRNPSPMWGVSGRSCPRHDLNSAGRCSPETGGARSRSEWEGEGAGGEPGTELHPYPLPLRERVAAKQPGEGVRQVRVAHLVPSPCGRCASAVPLPQGERE